MNIFFKKGLYVMLAAALLAPATGAYAVSYSLPDCLLTVDCVYKYTFTDFERARQIMSELRKKQQVPEYKWNIAEGDLYFNTGHYYQALHFYGRAFRSQAWNPRYKDFAR